MLSVTHYWQPPQLFGGPVIVSTVNRVFSNLINLTEISITESTQITGKNIAINCVNLIKCNFSFLTELLDEFVINLSRRCPQLTDVNLMQCKKLTENAFITLVKNGKYLSVLNFSGCKLSSDVFEAIAIECVTLTAFNVNNCKNVKDSTIIPIIQSNQQLTALHLRDSSITDKTLFAIAEKLTGFQVLDVSKCRVTDAGMIRLVESCKSLSELIFEPNPFAIFPVTVNTFIAIATHCPNLGKFRFPSQILNDEVVSKV